MKNPVLTKKYFDDGRPPESFYVESKQTGPEIINYDTSYLDDIEGSTADFDYPEKQLPAVRTNKSLVLPAAKNRQARIPVLPVQDTRHTIDVPLNATQHIEMKTSAVDRAQGFAIATTQLGLVISLAMLVVSVSFADVPLFSLWALSIFVLTYALVWLTAYYLTLRYSPEGIALYESKKKWGIIEREQEYRWGHYDLLTGREETGK